jgi:hypothetical protein
LAENLKRQFDQVQKDTPLFQHLKMALILTYAIKSAKLGHGHEDTRYLISFHATGSYMSYHVGMHKRQI